MASSLMSLPLDLLLDEEGRVGARDGVETAEGVADHRPSSSSWRQPLTTIPISFAITNAVTLLPLLQIITNNLIISPKKQRCNNEQKES